MEYNPENAGALAGILHVQTQAPPKPARRAIQVQVRYDGALVVLTDSGELRVQGEKVGDLRRPTRPFYAIPTPGAVKSFALSTDGRLVVVLADGSVHERVADNRQFKQTHEQPSAIYEWRAINLEE